MQALEKVFECAPPASA